jgi:hypothetical protein
MTQYIFTNLAKSTLAAGIGGGDTSFSVASGEGALFPSPSTNQAFRILVKEGSKEEYMGVQVRAGDVFSSIIRGGANSFNAGAEVFHLVDKVTLENFQQKHRRTTSTDPHGVLAAEYTGEEVYQTTTKQWWKHTEGLLWEQISS